LSSRAFAVETLKHLAKHEVPDDNLVSAKMRAQALDVEALRPLRKSIQTLLSTTITGFLAPCGYEQGCRANDICRKRRQLPAAAAI
jgi:hypothetical protein